jgi:hypothetical protein
MAGFDRADALLNFSLDTGRPSHGRSATITGLKVENSITAMPLYLAGRVSCPCLAKPRWAPRCNSA